MPHSANSVIKLSVVMLSVVFYFYAGCRTAKCSVIIVTLSVIMLNVVVLSVVALMPTAFPVHISSLSDIYISEVFCETASNSDCEFTCLRHLG